MATTVQPQGLESIIQALSIGGSPNGNIANLPSPVNPQTGLTALSGGAGPVAESQSQVPGVQVPVGEATGAIDPQAAALLESNPQLLVQIIAALQGAGIFNTPQMSA